MKVIDCRGLSCPEPVINTKKALKENSEGIVVLVDNKVALENISRFCKATGYKTENKELDTEWEITIKK